MNKNIDLKKVPKWRWRWYKFVANDLLLFIVDLTLEIAQQNEAINKLKLQLCVAQEEVKEWKEHVLLEKKDAAVADFQKVRENMRNQNPCILNAHERAAKQRIRDLQDELQKLKKDTQSKFHNPYDLRS